jgi:hypothetical protein
MGYNFIAQDDKEDANLRAVMDLNNLCKATKEHWNAVAKVSEGDSDDLRERKTLIADIIHTEELFYFKTDKPIEVMARRLCAALRMVAETIKCSDAFSSCPELINSSKTDATFFRKYLHASDGSFMPHSMSKALYFATAWSSHAHNALDIGPDGRERPATMIHFTAECKPQREVRSIAGDVFPALYYLREAVLHALGVAAEDIPAWRDDDGDSHGADWPGDECYWPDE